MNGYFSQIRDLKRELAKVLERKESSLKSQVVSTSNDELHGIDIKIAELDQIVLEMESEILNLESDREALLSSNTNFDSKEVDIQAFNELERNYRAIKKDLIGLEERAARGGVCSPAWALRLGDNYPGCSELALVLAKEDIQNIINTILSMSDPYEG